MIPAQHRQHLLGELCGRGLQLFEQQRRSAHAVLQQHGGSLGFTGSYCQIQQIAGLGTFDPVAPDHGTAIRLGKYGSLRLQAEM